MTSGRFEGKKRLEKKGVGKVRKKGLKEENGRKREIHETTRGKQM